MAQILPHLDNPLLVPSVKRKILIADDVLLNRVVLSRLLASMGFEVLQACTGEEAVEAFLQQDEGLFCVLMDINMPEMDGLEATLRIRQLEAQATDQPDLADCDEATVPGHFDDPRSCSTSTELRCSQVPQRRVPIWAISACSEKDQLCSPVFAQLSAEPTQAPPWSLVGIDGFMGKPINPQKLAGILSQLQSELVNRDTHLHRKSDSAAHDPKDHNGSCGVLGIKRTMSPSCLARKTPAKRRSKFPATGGEDARTAQLHSCVDSLPESGVV